jgi:Ca2+/Na+ antiporter
MFVLYIMEILLIVAAIFILGKTLKTKNKTGHRIIAGLIFAVTYFFIWPFCYYYFQLMGWSDLITQIGLAILIIIALILVRQVLTIEQHEIVLIISFITLFIFWVTSTTYEIEIKDSIAEQTGYFDPDFKFRKIKIPTKIINSPQGGYTLTIPANWNIKIQTGTKLPYYRPGNVNDAIIEFRPRCNNLQRLNIPTIVDSMTKTFDKNTSSTHLKIRRKKQKNKP